MLIRKSRAGKAAAEAQVWEQPVEPSPSIQEVAEGDSDASDLADAADAVDGDR